ncbi:MAG: hypothetical protein ACI8S6_005602 [Myxococcota bacterium]
MAARALIWAAATLLAAALAAPIDWRVAVLCALGALGAKSPRWMAICAAPLWAAAATSGHPLSLILLALAAVAVPRTSLGIMVLVLAIVEGARAWILVDVLPTSAHLVSPLLLGGLALGGLAATPAGKVPAYTLLFVAIMLGLGAGVSASGGRESRAEISAAARWGVLQRAPERVTDPALQRWALREAPQWHGLAARMPVEAALELGWQAEGAALEPERRVAAARWLEGRGRGGEALRVLRRGRDAQSRWWHTYFSRAAGTTASSEELVWVPEEAVRLPLSEQVFDHDQVRTFPLQLDEAAGGVEVVASAEWFLGPAVLMIELDAEQYEIVPQRSPRVFVLRQRLEAGPHRLRLRYDDDVFVDGVGDRNVYVHTIQVAAVSR